jgi:hypothetical protein
VGVYSEKVSINVDMSTWADSLKRIFDALPCKSVDDILSPDIRGFMFVCLSFLFVLTVPLQDYDPDVENKLAEVFKKHQGLKHTKAALATGKGWPKCFAKHKAARKAIKLQFKKEVRKLRATCCSVWLFLRAGLAQSLHTNSGAKPCQAGSAVGGEIRGPFWLGAFAHCTAAGPHWPSLVGVLASACACI